MTEIEAIMLLNQAVIMSALGMLVPDNMRQVLIEQAERTKDYVQTHTSADLDRG